MLVLSVPYPMSETARSDDRELIERLRRRDPQAMGDLYDRYGGPVYAIVRRIVRRPEVAEDLAQETFLRAWTRVQQIEYDCKSLGPWLLTIARNQALDYLRSRQSRTWQWAGEEMEAAVGGNPEKDALDSDQARRIRAAFEDLTSDQRQVIELAYFEGLSQTEMAEKLDRPLGTVKTWVRTGLERLRSALGATA